MKKIILENFLSFQRDEVEFSRVDDQAFPRLILVIGPNWSGKTSIFQAIKFALGSNERDERYKKWSDFIRNGQKHAMVELHLLHNGDSIKIRRIVLRGKAPYFEIKRNNEKHFHKIHAHKLQHLIEILEINPDNHFAFVSQGKIDAIKSLKPVELCNFIEEGIGLKVLRTEILQQKDSVFSLKNEFQSLKAKRNTLNFNLELLKPKLKRLEEKRLLVEERQKFLDELLWANKEKVQKELAQLDVKQKIDEDNIRSLNEKINQLIDELNEIDTKILVLEDIISKTTLEKGELTYQKKELLNAIEVWQNEKVNAKQELDRYAAVLLESEKNHDNLTHKRKKLANEIESITEEKNLIKENVANIIKEQSALLKKVEENKALLENYNDLLTRKQAFIKNIKDNEDTIKNTEKDINDIFQSLEDIDHKLDNNEWFLENPSKDILKQFEADIEASTSKLIELKLNLEQLERDRKRKIEKVKELENALKVRKIILPANINILKEEIKKRGLKDKVQGPIIDYLGYDDELSYAIESVLGERLLHSFIAKDWDTLILFRKLSQKFNAYCNIYLPKTLPISPYPVIKAEGVLGYLTELIKILDNDSDIQKVIYSKIKNCLVVKDYSTGKSLYISHNFKGKCVTLKGEQIVSYKYVYESPHIKKLRGLLSPGTQKEQLERLEAEINNDNDKYLELKAKQAELDEIQLNIYKKKELFNDLIYQFTTKQRLTEKKNQLYNNIYDLEAKNANISAGISKIDAQLKELETRTEPDFLNWNKRIKEIPEILNNLNTELNAWEITLDEKNQLKQQVKENIMLSENDLKVKRKELQEKRDNFKKLDKRAFEIYKKLEEIEEKIEKTESELVKLAENKQNLNQEKTKVNNTHLELKYRLEQEKILYSSITNEIEQKKSALKRIYAKISQKDHMDSTLIRPIETIEKDISQVEKKLLNYYDVDESIVVEQDHIMKNLKRITKNQKQMEDDINAALKTEEKLEKTYYNKFHLSLEDLNSKINTKFEEANIKAYCLLNLTGNFEDLGIEIKAATSKDQLKTCTALSGGQISMISINLILSLLEIKPSPLCMFDEAGMFLDEKNSEASYKMIKSTLDKNPVQLLMFLPKSSNVLYKLADKLIGVARVGKNETSMIFIPKIVKE